MKKENEFSVPLMAFSFLYAVAIYLVMVGVHFWHWHIDYKSEEPK